MNPGKVDPGVQFFNYVINPKLAIEGGGVGRPTLFYCAITLIFNNITLKLLGFSKTVIFGIFELIVERLGFGIRRPKSWSVL